MAISTNTKTDTFYKLFLFSTSLSLLTYGFALTNFTVTIDNESPIFESFGMSFGRWGQNLIRYHLFDGFLEYFTLLLSLLMYSLSGVRLSKLFKLEGSSAYFFCGLFVTFPQLSYQVVFSIMADVAALGVLLSVLSVELYIKGYESSSLFKKNGSFLAAALMIMFALSMYQAFILVPTTIYLILFFQDSFDDSFKLIPNMKKMLLFGAVVIFSAILYFLSVKIICPPIENSEYLSSFVSGNTENIFSGFVTICENNLKGAAYYGEKLYLLVPIAFVFLTISLILDRKYFVYRFLLLLFLIISPFLLSFFITNGYHPPRLYLTSNLVFAFLITVTLNRFKVSSLNVTKIAICLIAITNIYFVTNLFYTVNKIYKHDKKVAEKMDFLIQSKYPDFNAEEKPVYFYGYFPYDYHQKFRLDKSEIFGGSFFSWDNGNNYRIINFFKEADVAEYKMLESKEKLNVINDSVSKMKVWPNYESIKMINDVIVIKLGEEKGMPMYFE
jgi:hypothetical protein